MNEINYDRMKQSTLYAVTIVTLAADLECESTDVFECAEYVYKNGTERERYSVLVLYARYLHALEAEMFHLVSDMILSYDNDD